MSVLRSYCLRSFNWFLFIFTWSNIYLFYIDQFHLDLLFISPWSFVYFPLIFGLFPLDLFLFPLDLLFIWPWPYVYLTLIFCLFHLDILFISPWSIVYFTLIFCLFHLEFLVISPWSLVYFTLIFCWFPLDYGSYILDYSLNWFWNILLFVLDPSSHS